MNISDHRTSIQEYFCFFFLILGVHWRINLKKSGRLGCGLNLFHICCKEKEKLHCISVIFNLDDQDLFGTTDEI